ncbi:type IV toxin-antitoxin system AbiEi family antitoxin domain-containing protein [Actinoallomurus sp. NPDC052274]|uniref:type IV toxin-antitoxin system AbiEi family antitoxin domain-containing protein n=1 Tax=Actinoallomurus sp. NPDC052274 TaxID=3155420 RepID=UPI003417E5B9
MLEEVLVRQHGVIARWQALACGLSEAALRARVGTGRWQRIFTGVYAAFSGPLSREAVLWAVVLRAGPGATLSHRTAAELEGLVDDVRGPIHVTVGRDRTVVPVEGVRLHYSSRVDDARHPARLPPRTTVEETVLDLAVSAPDLDEAMAWLARACQRRRTTPERLLRALRKRKRVRWRAELTAALADVDEGATTPLEIRFVRDVERAHGLPPSARQVRSLRGGRVTYEDVRAEAYGVVIELDGRAAHPFAERHRDMRRDNAAVRAGRAPLRYGWGDVTERPCLVAAEIADVYRSRGWTGTPHPCGAGCLLAAAA